MTDAAVTASLLVVDDSLTSCIVLAKQLQKLGYEVDTANSGQEALLKLDKKQYQLMLLDCFMPDMDGFAVTKHIRDQEKISSMHLPIIGVSGETDIEHKKLCLMHGMDGVLEKPVDAEALKNVIQLWCQVPDEHAIVAKPIHVSKEDLQTIFYETTQQDLLDLQNAIATENRESAQRLAHRMKGAALTLGKHEMAKHITELEQLLKKCTIEVQLCQQIIQAIDQNMHK